MNTIAVEFEEQLKWY